MLGINLSYFNPVEYIKVHLTSGRTKLLIVLLLGLSASAVTAGLLLRSRRRRYRAVSTSLQRSDTFYEASSGREDTSGISRESSVSHTPNNYVSDFSSQTNNAVPITKLQEDGHQRVSEASHFGASMEPSSAPVASVVSDKVAGPLNGGREEETDGGAANLREETEEEEEELGGAEDEAVRRSSMSSNDSFYSAEGEDLEVDLYMAAKKLVQQNKVKCRKNRAVQLECEDEQDFLAKLHCVRQAFDKLVQTPDYRMYFMNITRDLMSNILQGANQDPTPFLTRFKELTDFLEDEVGWEKTKKELTARKVECVNIYDVALDFVLLDAFDDLRDPPTTLVNVLQNRWLTENLKISGISTVIWAVSKTKKGLLKTKDGFMFRFYSLSETISPILAWGFMGNNVVLKTRCSDLKVKVTDFIKYIFSRDKVDYSSVDSLASDVLHLAREMVQSMQT